MIDYDTIMIGSIYIDIGDFYEQIYKKWRMLKYLSGFYKDAWELNTPKDGIIDRFQVAMYPSGSGEQELHQDPYLFQKFFIILQSMPNSACS